MIVKLLIRLGLALVCGALIGFERERGNRPAGLRTHVLVCVSAALVMLTGEYVFERFSPDIDIDPLRLGAQVVSGIGFLGAGAIIREGASVRGLTTAAALWAAACIGLAAGAGFYAGAIITTLLVYITLVVLRGVERAFNAKTANLGIYVELSEPLAQERVEAVLERYGVHVVRSDKRECGNELLSKYRLHRPEVVSKRKIISELCKVDGVSAVYEDGRRHPDSQ